MIRLKFLAEKPYQILWVDGNHENFTLINDYPVEEWCGGKVHIIRRNQEGNPKIIHLMRGQVVTFKHWFMGHHYVERDIDLNLTVLWFQLRNMETNEIMEE